MADGRDCVVYRWNDVLTSEEAQGGAVEEGMRSVPPQTCSTVPSETSLSHRGSLLIHFDIAEMR